MQKLIIATGLIAAGAATNFLVQWANTTPPPPATQINAIVSVALPEALSPDAMVGRATYQAKCAACHGENAAGQDSIAPPLVHKIYEPSHHGDEAFQRAAALGVRGHHWSFGDMPPIEGLTRADVSMIVAYIRELQRFNNIN